MARRRKALKPAAETRRHCSNNARTGKTPMTGWYFWHVACLYWLSPTSLIMWSVPRALSADASCVPWGALPPDTPRRPPNIRDRE